MQDISSSSLQLDGPMKKFLNCSIIGAGSYGTVYSAFDNQAKKKVAIKKIKLDLEDEGIPSSAYREIISLKEVKSEYNISLLEIIFYKNKLFLVLEYMPFDLKTYIQFRKCSLLNLNYEQLKKEDKLLTLDRSLPPKECINIFKQLIWGLYDLHRIGIVHRDIKPHNLLFSFEGELKICDFGLARLFETPVGKYTKEVITLWYRPPEILLGKDMYTDKVDVWSAACIFVELLNGAPLFAGDCEINQLQKIFEVLGTPSRSNWPEALGLPYFEKVKPVFKKGKIPLKRLGTRYAKIKEIIKKCLLLNPDERPSTKELFEEINFVSL